MPSPGLMPTAATPSGAGVRAVVDANEAVARVAHAYSEVIPIYPITPASPMAEHADAWSAKGRRNLWGTVPEVTSLQSEAGAAGALHGAVTRGALGTTFTASQGLLLMIPNMYKIAGELTPTVIHVAARTIATHALSIFGDHSDVMACRQTGFAMLCASSVQEAGDFAAVAHAATLASRVPFLHFFDGFRTSHELASIELLDEEVLRGLIDPRDLAAHRLRGLDPDRPVLRGTAQNPDVFFQAREAANPFYDALPGIVADTFDRLAAETGRHYGLVDYVGHPEAERVVVLMGSGVGAAQEAVRTLMARDARVGLVTVRLYRPFPVAELLAALPATTRRIAVLDRTKEPGAPADPLHLDVLAALADPAAASRFPAGVPRTIGVRYGLSSKEFTPAMAAGVFTELRTEAPRRQTLVGIVDDVGNASLEVPIDFPSDSARVRAVFFGLGSDGTVGANKNTATIVGGATDLNVQAYFVYDSKKSGSVTVSHLRFDPAPITSTYLISEATFVGVHQWSLLERQNVLGVAGHRARVLINSPYPAEEVWDRLPLEVQQQVLAKDLELWCVDAAAVARQAGIGGRINTVMQTCFFAVSEVLPVAEATPRLVDAVRRSYGKRGSVVVERNLAAIAAATERLQRVPVPDDVTATHLRRPPVPESAPDFVARVTARMLAGEGDLLPVSALPVDGSFPTGTAAYEKRTIATEIPIWAPDLCIDCGKCAIVCPHASIRMGVFDPAENTDVTESELPRKTYRNRERPGLALTIQVAPDDCTGCGVCVAQCPAFDKSEVRRKAITMQPIGDHLDVERQRWDAFQSLTPVDTATWSPDTVKTSQLRQPLFEFSGACSGCGETPYLKLLTQLFGDRLLIANATGCSSIYGGNLPTTPYTVNAEGRGPAWSNSLFEDNAEFGLGMRLAFERQQTTALTLLAELEPVLGLELVGRVAGGYTAGDDAGIREQRATVAELVRRLEQLTDDPRAAALIDLSTALVRRSFWIVGGDGWAYDIGYGGLDHVLASGRNINVLVMDTEVYSNTGGQQSKATPRGAVAKFAAAGKGLHKKDLGLEAMAYGDVYVAQVAVGANEVQTVKALVEAEAHPGPSLVIAYSTCIAHGFDMGESMGHQKLAVTSGHWPLYRYRPTVAEGQPFQLDSKAPSVPFADFARREARFAMLYRSDPARAKELLERSEEDIAERWRYYEQLAGLQRVAPRTDPADLERRRMEEGESDE